MLYPPAKKRKSKKRPPEHLPPKPKLDDDLTELAIALAQYELDPGASGWLKMPWRDGWNAVSFAAGMTLDLEPRSRALGLVAHVYAARSIEETRARAYWDLQNMLETRDVQGDEGPFARAAYRCMQVMLTERGSGDGSIFNAILERPVETLGRSSEHVTADAAKLMEIARCNDAIGVPGPSLQNDRNDYLRRAFSIAWRRRLYAAAYSLPPAVKLS